MVQIHGFEATKRCSLPSFSDWSKHVWMFSMFFQFVQAHNMWHAVVQFFSPWNLSSVLRLVREGRKAWHFARIFGQRRCNAVVGSNEKFKFLMFLQPGYPQDLPSATAFVARLCAFFLKQPFCPFLIYCIGERMRPLWQHCNTSAVFDTWPLHKASKCPAVWAACCTIDPDPGAVIIRPVFLQIFQFSSIMSTYD